MSPNNKPDADPSASRGTAEVLDEQALARLRELDPTGRSGILSRVLRTYEGSQQKLMAQFEQSRASDDRAGLRHVAHTLRSSSASIGALGLAQRCSELEALVREGRADGLEAAVQGLAEESRRVAEAVRAILAQEGPTGTAE